MPYDATCTWNLKTKPSGNRPLDTESKAMLAGREGWGPAGRAPGMKKQTLPVARHLGAGVWRAQQGGAVRAVAEPAGDVTWTHRDVHFVRDASIRSLCRTPGARMMSYVNCISSFF